MLYIKKLLSFAANFKMCSKCNDTVHHEIVCPVTASPSPSPAAAATPSPSSTSIRAVMAVMSYIILLSRRPSLSSDGSYLNYFHCGAGSGVQKNQINKGVCVNFIAKTSCKCGQEGGWGPKFCGRYIRMVQRSETSRPTKEGAQQVPLIHHLSIISAPTTSAATATMAAVPSLARMSGMSTKRREERRGEENPFRRRRSLSVQQKLTHP